VCLWEEGLNIFCVCLNGWESESGLGEGEGECLLLFFTQMKRFVLIYLGFLVYPKISLCMYFITVYKIKYFINLFNNFKNI